MILLDKDLNLLENYLDGALDDSAKNALVARINNDTIFRAEAKAYMQTLVLMKKQRNAVLKAKMTVFEEEKPIKRSTNLTWWIAGLSTAAAACALFFMLKTPQNEAVALAQRHFEPLALQGNKGIEDEQRIAALQAYLDKNYHKAAPLLDNIFQKNNKDTSLLLLSGIAYLADNQADKCIQRLANISRSTREDRDEACWYEALAQVAVGNNQEENSLLNQLVENKSDYTEKAKILKNEIK
jgi:hypothetical protein